MKSVVISLASYDKRLNYLKQTIQSILSQTLDYSKLLINIPAENSIDIIEGFKKLQMLDSRIEVKLRDGKWRSANKLLFSAKEYPDVPIITCDDDIFYPSNFFKALYDKWLENKNCIIAHEISPVFVQNGLVQHISMVDIKLGQKTFGRYLTGCCLFPPGVLNGTDAYDFEKYFKVTNATHDELWFWCMTTMKGIQSIGLNYTYSFDADGVVLPRDENSLSKINSDPYLKEYNQKINEVYGSQLYNILKSQVCEFIVSKDNILAFIGNIKTIFQIYGLYYKIRLICDSSILKSHLEYLLRNLKTLNWINQLEIV